jgi:hypothetical protein
MILVGLAVVVLGQRGSRSAGKTGEGAGEERLAELGTD